VRWPEDASDNEPNLRLARELHVRRALVTATGNAAEGIPRGNIRGREGPACGRQPDWMQHYPAHVTCSRRTSSSRDQPPVGCLAERSEDLLATELL
jgi:hypothetical protein